MWGFFFRLYLFNNLKQHDMDSPIFTTIEVEEIKEIKPKIQRNRPFTLNVKVEMTTHQLAEVLLNVLEDFGQDYLNEYLKEHGLTLIYNKNN